MKEKFKYFKCPICSNIIEVVNGDIERVKCCDKTPEELIANTIDASLEKHVPTYEIDNNEIIELDLENKDVVFLEEDGTLLGYYEDGKIIALRMTQSGENEYLENAEYPLTNKIIFEKLY